MESIFRLLNRYEITFYGHEVFPNGLLLTIVLPFFTLFALVCYLRVKKRRVYSGMLFWGLVFIALLPNATYLMLEIKHIIFLDNIADGSEIIPKLAFSTLYIGGFLLTISTILLVIEKSHILNRHALLSVVVLTTVSSFGATMGLLEINSWDILSNPYSVFLATQKIFSSWEYIRFITLLGTILSITALVMRRLIKELM